MNILIACEESQTVCKAFREKGHRAFSCDIIECSGKHPEWHIRGDVLPLLRGNDYWFKTDDGKRHYVEMWDLIIAHPPCTHLSSSGQWAYKKGKDINLKYEAIEFFMEFVKADCKKICIENPVGVMSTEWRKPNQIIHPWQFGHLAEKQTCLWLIGLPNLLPEVDKKPELEYFEWVDKNGKKKRMQKWMYDIRRARDGCKQAKMASKTFEGIAKAMAEQWG
jgi:hypothetical protein